MPPSPIESNEDETAAVLKQIKKRVADRRSSGDYPPGLEDQLDRHYRQILKGFDTEETPDLHMALQNLRAASVFHPTQIETWAKNPFKRFLHRVTAKLVIRQTRGVLNQIEQHVIALDSLLNLIVDNMQDPVTGTHDHSPLSNKKDTERRLSAVLDRLSLVEENLRLNQTRD